MNSMTFEQWKAAVNEAVENRYGMSADDLPDCPYYEWYEDGMKPATAASKARRNAMAG